MPNEGRPGRGVPLRAGLVIAIEPWFLAGGSDDYRVDADGWTLRSADGSRAAHVEHTVAVTDDGPRILTAALTRGVGPLPRVERQRRGASACRRSAQRLVQVGEQVVDVLDADREPHQVAGHLERRAGGAGVGHPARVLDQRLDAAERLGQREQLRPLADLQRGVLAVPRAGTRPSRRSRTSASRRCRGRGASGSPG